MRSPFQPLPEFASLPREQLDYIHDILRHKTYDEAQQEIWSSLGCRISTNRLQRYREKIDLAAALEIADEDTLPAVDQLNNLLAGRETNIAAAGLLVIQQRALALAASPKTSPTLLKDLFRIFTYDDRKHDNAHRKLIAEQREATRKEALHDRKDLNQHRKAMDLRRAEIFDRREKNRAAASEHRKKIDLHKARLAEQREQTRKQLADLAARRQEQQLAREKHLVETQDELTERADAVIAYGREVLRREREAARSCSADNPVCESEPERRTQDSNTIHQP